MEETQASGRGRRIGVSACLWWCCRCRCSEEYRLVLDLMFAAWLAYSMAFTFVRYGVFDARAGGRRQQSRLQAAAFDRRFPESVDFEVRRATAFRSVFADCCDVRDARTTVATVIAAV